MTQPYVGQPIRRVDGREKVTGAATYSAEYHPQGVVHGAIVRSTIAHGRITTMDIEAARTADGVLAVITHENAPHTPSREHKSLVDPEVGERLRVLKNDRVNHQGQPIALVVADTVERATYAATLVRVTYSAENALTDVARVEPVLPTHAKADEPGGDRPAVAGRGNAEQAIATAPVKVDQTYVIPRENHNPIELHATIASWKEDRLTLWDKTQWVTNVAEQLAADFGVPAENVRVISPFVGGAFGSGLRPWAHVYLSALGARVTGRPVKVMLTRREMYYGTGYRPHTVQRVALGASRDGRLTGIVHEAFQEISTYEEYRENLLSQSRYLYSCPNVRTLHRLAPMNIHTPAAMRGPGEVSGIFALETAMDELAVSLNIDPISLRLMNEPKEDEDSGKPFSSRSLTQCYRQGAERFGWSRRNPEPRSMRDGQWLIGWGMAAATYPANTAPSTAKARLLPDGTAEVMTAASDMGPGTWTSMTQIAADALGLPIERVKFTLGDTVFPKAAVHGGSLTMASVGGAVEAACRAVRESALSRSGATDLTKAMRQLGQAVEATVESKPDKDSQQFSRHAFAAVFAEVGVDSDLCETRVRRIVGAYGVGRVVNPKLAHSQCMGGMIGGIGMALMEHSVVDVRNGRVPNASLAEYAMPVHADAPPVIETIFVDEQDSHVNSLGVKGLAEIAIIGVAPAIANAVYHATGKRIRELPITPDKLL